MFTNVDLVIHLVNKIRYFFFFSYDSACSGSANSCSLDYVTHHSVSSANHTRIIMLVNLHERLSQRANEHQIVIS